MKITDNPINSTILIKNNNTNEYGTGFFTIFNKTIYCLTVEQLFKNNEQLNLSINNETTSYTVSNYFKFEHIDSIIIKNPLFFNPNIHEPLIINPCPRFGENISILGHLNGEENNKSPLVKKGCVISIESSTKLLLNLHNNHGFSGGPVINEKNETIGIVSSIPKNTNPNSKTTDIVLNSDMTVAYGLNLIYRHLLNNKNTMQINKQ